MEETKVYTVIFINAFPTDSINHISPAYQSLLIYYIIKKEITLAFPLTINIFCLGKVRSWKVMSVTLRCNIHISLKILSVLYFLQTQYVYELQKSIIIKLVRYFVRTFF